MQHITEQYITIQYIAVYYITQQYITVQFIAVLYITVQYAAVQFLAVQCDTGRVPLGLSLLNQYQGVIVLEEAACLLYCTTLYCSVLLYFTVLCCRLGEITFFCEL